MELTTEKRERLAANRAAALRRRRGLLQRELSEEDAEIVEFNRQLARLRLRSRFLLPVLPQGWACNAAPPVPASFGADFLLPQHEKRLLSVLNKHERDSRIVFHAGPHVYEVDGVPTLGSVTGVAHAFAHPFDQDAIIDKMRRGRNWPRRGYLRGSVPDEVATSWKVYPLGQQLLDLIAQNTGEEDAIVALARRFSHEHASADAWVRDIGLSPKEIVLKWDANRVESSNRGTWMHFCFELWLNCERVHYSTAEMYMFFVFLNTLQGCVAFRTEWEIFGEDQ